MEKPIWTDYHLNVFKWYRKWRKCTWYKHQFTNDALQLSVTFTGTWWALYGKINRYSDVVKTEEYSRRKQHSNAFICVRTKEQVERMTDLFSKD